MSPDPAEVLAAAAGSTPALETTGTTPIVNNTFVAPEEDVSGRPDDVPTDRPLENVLAEERRKREKAEQEAEELRQWRQEREQAEMTELERAQAAQQEAQQRAEQAEERAMQLERSGFILRAAQQAGFTDPEDAIIHLSGDLKDIDSPEKALQAVTQLADRKKHLVGGRASDFDAGARTAAPPDVPRTPTGEVDVRQGLGRDLLKTLGR